MFRSYIYANLLLVQLGGRPTCYSKWTFDNGTSQNLRDVRLLAAVGGKADISRWSDL